MTTKLIQHDQNQPVTVAQIEGKTNETLDSLLTSDRHVKSAILAETHEEKLERKQLVRERRYERIVEQQKIVHHMEELVEKVKTIKLLLFCLKTTSQGDSRDTNAKDR